MALTELQRRSARKAMDRYVRCFNEMPAAGPFRFCYLIEDDGVLLLQELAPRSRRRGPERMPVALIRFDEADRAWSLHYPDERGQWQPHPECVPRPSLSAVLDLVSSTPDVILWSD